jgi:choline dehydrogenase
MARSYKSMNGRAKNMREEHYDYIIAGGGSAGCVLANRLTSSGNHKVCMLEAGPEDNTLFITIPGAFAWFMFSKKYNWSFDAEPAADIRDGKPLFCPQGRGLGGGSAINAMIYIRGHRVDYDHWASLGNRGWGWFTTRLAPARWAMMRWPWWMIL